MVFQNAVSVAICNDVKDRTVLSHSFMFRIPKAQCVDILEMGPSEGF